MSEPVSSTAIHREFGGVERRFELPIGEIKKLEQATGAGIGEIYRRIISLSFTLDDVRLTIKRGLVGGGEVEEATAQAMVLASDAMPIDARHRLAQHILLACFFGVDASGNIKGLGPQGGQVTSSPSTKPGPPPASDPARSMQ